MARTLISLPMLALATLCACAAAFGAPAVLTVPVAPWTFPDQPGRGIAPEYLGYLFASAGVEVALGTRPYLRVMQGLQDGSNLAALLIPDAQRDVFAMRLCEVGTIRSGVLYKKSRFKQLTLAQLAGLTVGIQHGTHALDKLDTVAGIKSYTVQSVEQGLGMLKLDRLDATFLSSPGSDIMLCSAGLSVDDYAWLEIDAAPVVVYLSRKAPLTRDANAVRRLKTVCNTSAQEVMRELMRKYH